MQMILELVGKHAADLNISQIHKYSISAIFISTNFHLSKANIQILFFRQVAGGRAVLVENPLSISWKVPNQPWRHLIPTVPALTEYAGGKAFLRILE